VLDFDDTLAFHKNRDFDNATPNVPLIEKCNNLFDQGWCIDIFTARGSISCGTRQEASDKYRASMEEWLKRNKVKYTSLSFDKPLAAYYIDDKGITPELFLQTNISNLTGGLSGSDIYTDGKVVHKTAPNSLEVQGWFEHVEGKVSIPKVERVVGQTITMEYIDHDKNFFNDNQYIAIGLAQQTLETFKSIPIMEEKNFKTYIDRIQSHVSESDEPYFGEVLNYLSKMSFGQTFSHGDFGINNLLFKDKTLYLIDPIPNVFGCIELDAAKLCATLLINNYTQKQFQTTFLSMQNYLDIDVREFEILVSSEIIRVYKYHPDKKFIMECVENVLR